MSTKPARLSWDFDPDIPTQDFFEQLDLSNLDDLDDAVDKFVYKMNGGDFLTWEAVMREEQGMPLTKRHKKALRELLSFEDDPSEEILYINEIARPSQPWYEILNRIAPYLLVEPFETTRMYYEAQIDGWARIMKSVDKHGRHLSLPEGARSPAEVVPAELRHKLWLQHCIDILGGLGQHEDLTLADPEAHPRIDEVHRRMKEHKESVAYFDLTLDRLMKRVILPEADRPIFVQLMQEKLGLGSTQEPLATRLA